MPAPFIYSSGGVYQWGLWDDEIIYLDWDEVSEGNNIEYAEEMREKIENTYTPEERVPYLRNVLDDLENAIRAMKEDR